MHWTLCETYRDHGYKRKGKDYYNLYKEVMREHEMEKIIKSNFPKKLDQASINRAIILPWGHFSAIFKGFMSLKLPPSPSLVSLPIHILLFPYLEAH